MAKLFDLVKVNIATTGTGTVTFGSVFSPEFFTPSEVGAADGDTVRYVLIDGTNIELGTGVIGGSVTTVTRTVTRSRVGGVAGTSKINLSGTAYLALTASAADILNPSNNLSDVASVSTSRSNLQVGVAGHLFGLTLSTAGSSTTFSVAAGEAADSTNTGLMVLGSAISKTTSAWSVGSGNGALDTGTISASSWYHVFLIKRTDTGVVDVLISTSATAPTLPTNYTLFRRIGTMFLNSSSQWMKFSQNGDEFLWDVPLNNVGGSPGTTAIQTVNLSVPSGFKVTALLNVSGQGGAGSDGRGWIFSADTNSAGALSTSSTSINFGESSSTSQTWGTFRVRTNASGQIKYAMLAADGKPIITTVGWVDDRGKLQ